LIITYFENSFIASFFDKPATGNIVILSSGTGRLFYFCR
jgi:hypothetical protein